MVGLSGEWMTGVPFVGCCALYLFFLVIGMDGQTSHDKVSTVKLACLMFGQSQVLCLPIGGCELARIIQQASVKIPDREIWIYLSNNRAPECSSGLSFLKELVRVPAIPVTRLSAQPHLCCVPLPWWPHASREVLSLATIFVSQIQHLDVTHRCKINRF